LKANNACLIKKFEPEVMHRCRPNCAACCIAPSISSAIPGMPEGKPAGIQCIQLTDDFLCKLIDSPDRPGVCFGFVFDPLICGKSREEAMKIIFDIEK
jgi:Fe-S-cluster containining protein